MAETITAYPLTWPRGKSRTPWDARKRSNFSRRESQMVFRDGTYSHTRSDKKYLSIADATRRLTDELDRLGAKNPIISTNLDLRKDGLPRSGQPEPRDPGVAVYFKLDGEPVVLAVDKFSKVADNLAAIAAHINASRAVERYGVGTLKEIFRGFTALPGATAPMDWRTVLNNPQSLDQAVRAYYHLAKIRHPDKGGSTALMAELNAAIAKAREVLK